jgi:uncharacterized membrane protein YkvA (DUF1232 family)
VDLFFRGLIFICAYCLAWATFDPQNIEGYVMGLFNAVLGIVYVFSPIDIVPDVLPVVGTWDDSVFGLGMVSLGVSAWYRNKMRETKTETVLELVNYGNRDRALQLLLEDKGITINTTNSEN